MTVLGAISPPGDIMSRLLAWPDVQDAAFGPGQRGWITCDRAARPAVLERLRALFGPGPVIHDMFTAAAGARVLIVDPTHNGALPPGFAAIAFLDDATERRFVRDSLTRLDRIEACLHSAPPGTIADEITHLLACLFWRDQDLPAGPVAFGPWQTLAARLSPEASQVDLRACLAEIRALIADQHGGQVDPAAPPPVWYTETEACAYDSHRHFPPGIGARVTQILNAIGVRHVVEIGAGTGRFARALLGAGARTHMTLTDNAPAMLDRLRTAFTTDQVTVWQGRMDDIVTLSQGADAILEHEVFFLHPNPARLARHLAQAIGPRALLIRLERHSTPDAPLRRMGDLFDREVALALGSPVGFVGEGIFDALDTALLAQGIATCRVSITQAPRTVTRAAFLTARKARAFPYLAHVPQDGLDLALARAAAACDSDRFTLSDRYDVAVSGHPEALAALKELES